MTLPRLPALGSTAPTSYAARASLRWRFMRGLTLLLRERICGLPLDVAGQQHLPTGESLIVAAGPHRNGMDAILLLHALPPEPRVYFLGSRDALRRRAANRLAVGAFGGVVPVATDGQFNRESLTTALGILDAGASLGLFPEGADLHALPDDRLAPLQRGVAFLAMRSGRRVLPVGISNTRELWRGKPLALRIGAPLEPPKAGTPREREAALLTELSLALEELKPPAMDLPRGSRQPWRWLSRLVG